MPRLAVPTPPYREVSKEIDIFIEAATFHSDGRLDADVTIMTCWDADRLDLYRVGTRPIPERLCTEPARQPEVIEWAVSRSMW